MFEKVLNTPLYRCTLILPRMGLRLKSKLFHNYYIRLTLQSTHPAITMDIELLTMRTISCNFMKFFKLNKEKI